MIPIEQPMVTPTPQTATPALVRWLAFPLILACTVGLAIAMTERGVAPPMVVLIVSTAAIVLIFGAERLWPFIPDWNRAQGDVTTDLSHMMVSGIGMTSLARPLVLALGVTLAGRLEDVLGLSLWPGAWPLWAQLALALLIAELPQYWLHRLEHERDLLWRFHSIHHSAPRLYWLNAARFHPIDLLLLYVAGYLPLVLLGCPESVIALFAIFDAVFGMLQHSNIDVRIGPLNYIFSMAEPHRWHHSLRLEEANTNYGSNLIVWDLVFGTFFLPTNRPGPEEIGIPEMPGFPAGWRAQVLAPFRWLRVQAESRAP